MIALAGLEPFWLTRVGLGTLIRATIGATAA